MPEDFKYRNLVSEDFINACRDYFYLVDRHFPERGVLKLVGDRYKLDGDQRTVLYRGISSQHRSERRKALIVSDIRKRCVFIDGYNVLFTLLNYRLGRTTFISTDHILRDAGSLHGKFRDEKTFSDCIRLLMDYLVIKQPCTTEIFLDSPVSHSERHAQWICEQLQANHLKGGCSVIRSADWALKQSRNGVIATSDSVIIEKSMAPVIDLPREILGQIYHARFLNLTALLSTGKIENAVDDG